MAGFLTVVAAEIPGISAQESSVCLVAPAQNLWTLKPCQVTGPVLQTLKLQSVTPHLSCQPACSNTGVVGAPRSPVEGSLEATSGPESGILKTLGSWPDANHQEFRLDSNGSLPWIQQKLSKCKVLSNIILLGSLNHHLLFQKTFVSSENS